MRKLLMATVTGAAILGGVAIASATAAQPYEPGYRYNEFGRLYYDDGYPVRGYGDVPYDRFGPDPNGMIAADGHRIKCKLQDTYSYRFDRYVTRRVCD